MREIQCTSLSDIIRRNTAVTNLQGDVFFFRTAVGGNVFADLNHDGRRQAPEVGLAGASVAIVNAAGVTVASTTTDARGNYVFKGLDLGTFRVVVTRPGGDTVSSRTIAVTRGGEVRDVNVAVAPKTTVAPTRPAAPRLDGPARTAVFASLGVSDLGPARRS